MRDSSIEEACWILSLQDIASHRGKVKRFIFLIPLPLFFKFEWLLRALTEEVATENEVSNVENNAGQGNFTQRVNLQGKEGFFLNLSTQINSLMQTSEVGLNDVARVLSALAKGDLKQRIMDFFNV